MTSTQTISIIGLGYVGLPTAALLADSGFTVTGVDISVPTLTRLRNSDFSNLESDVRNILRRVVEAKKLTFSGEVISADVHIIAVPTPVNADHSANLNHVQSVCDGLAKVVKEGDMIILESTSPVGTTEGLVANTFRGAGFDPINQLDIAYCPERVYPGNTIWELTENDRLVGGLSKRAGIRAADFLKSICRKNIITCSASEAEYVKLVENSARDVNIALANTFAQLAEEIGIDFERVRTLVNQHPRVELLKPGPDVGGHCIPVDPWFLISTFPEHSRMLEISREINSSQSSHCLDRAEKNGLKPGSKIAILGIAFRADLDDPRNSAAENFIKELHLRGYDWVSHDPHIKNWAPENSLPANLISDFDNLFEECDAAVILTDHIFYRGLKPENFRLLSQKLIIDTRRILSVEEFTDSGYCLIPLGAPVVGGGNITQLPKPTTGLVTV